MMGWRKEGNRARERRREGGREGGREGEREGEKDEGLEEEVIQNSCMKRTSEY